jgi:hypothetical protein
MFTEPQPVLLEWKIRDFLNKLWELRTFHSFCKIGQVCWGLFVVLMETVDELFSRLQAVSFSLVLLYPANLVLIIRPSLIFMR